MAIFLLLIKPIQFSSQLPHGLTHSLTHRRKQKTSASGGTGAAFNRVRTAAQVLKDYGIEDLDELLPLSQSELEDEFAALDAVTFRRLLNAIEEAKQHPAWLSQELLQV